MKKATLKDVLYGLNQGTIRQARSCVPVVPMFSKKARRSELVCLYKDKGCIVRAVHANGFDKAPTKREYFHLKRRDASSESDWIVDYIEEPETWVLDFLSINYLTKEGKRTNALYEGRSFQDASTELKQQKDALIYSAYGHRGMDFLDLRFKGYAY